MTELEILNEGERNAGSLKGIEFEELRVQLSASNRQRDESDAPCCREEHLGTYNPRRIAPGRSC